MGKGHKKRKLPRLGWRIIKTGICVLICLIAEYMSSPEVGLISSIAAVVCLGSSLRNTLRNALSNFLGALIGGVAGMLFIPLAQNIEIEWLYIILMPLGLMLTIYLCIALGVPQVSTVCAFAYVTVLIVPYGTGTESPYAVAISYIVDTTFGILVAVLVNRFIAPPRKRKPSDLHIEADHFNAISAQFKHRLTGYEELLLFDTALIDGSVPEVSEWMHPTDIPINLDRESVGIPVPEDFQSQNYLNGAYISAGYAVIPFYLRQKDGYTYLPMMARPVTIAWHAVVPDKETYGVLHEKQLYGPEALRPAVAPVRTLYRRAPKPPDAESNANASFRVLHVRHK